MPNPEGMKRANRISASERNRAVARLRSLTVGTALAAVAASGIFGGLAAVTWSGSSSTNTADLLTTTASPAPTSQTTTNETTSSSPTTTTQPSATPTPTIRPTTTPVTTSTSAGQVTSGGS